MSDTQWVDRCIEEAATTIHNQICELLAEHEVECRRQRLGLTGQRSGEDERNGRD